MEKDLKKFHLVYKSSTGPFFPSCLVGGCFGNTFTKVPGIKIKSKKLIVVIENGTVNWFFDETLSETAQKMFDRIFSYSNYIDYHKKEEKRLSGLILKEISTPLHKIFSKRKLNEIGEQKLKKLFKLVYEYAELVDTPGFLFQVYRTEDLKKDIFKSLHGKNENEKNVVLNFLLSSYKLTNYENFLFSILKAVKGEKTEQASERIAKKYFWLLHDYFGQIIDKKYIQIKMKELQNNHGHLTEQYIEAKRRIKKIQLIKKELPKNLLKKINTAQEILHIYSERKKEITNQANIFIRKVFEYKYPKISVSKLKQLFQITPEEAIRILKDEKVADLEKRDKRWVYVIENEIIENGPDKYFALIESKNNGILKGAPASPGIVRGRINIVLNISQIGKFKKGDILAAPYTSVNYLPVMYNAKAILTETGGLTSHAAIVSRELKKPSIVGIKGLLSSLQDGDLVEVNANKGIIKKLK